ncbi:hypothetical protein BC833DRAFT_417669 [Globomyces pollinis-pini]|nr:hypothetical protein BC833DRAFT_417669 [Globomyces pollinis-pini]KAJ2994712.1 hypothetical protein HDV02_001367 [Globomyces sp. JEL0801]
MNFLTLALALPALSQLVPESPPNGPCSDTIKCQKGLVCVALTNGLSSCQIPLIPVPEPSGTVVVTSLPGGITIPSNLPTKLPTTVSATVSTTASPTKAPAATTPAGSASGLDKSSLVLTFLLSFFL